MKLIGMGPLTTCVILRIIIEPLARALRPVLYLADPSFDRRQQTAEAPRVAVDLPLWPAAQRTFIIDMMSGCIIETEFCKRWVTSRSV